MNKRLGFLLLFLLVASPVLAQTDTPTPTLTPTETPVPAMPVPTFDLIASPTPIATNAAVTIEPASGLPVNDLYNYLGTAYVALNQAPDDITHPGGQPILPDAQVSVLFSFAKWLFSSSTADALAGPFAPLLFYLGIYFGLVIVMTGLYMLAVIVRAVLRWIVYIYTQITKAIP